MSKVQHVISSDSAPYCDKTLNAAAARSTEASNAMLSVLLKETQSFYHMPSASSIRSNNNSDSPTTNSARASLSPPTAAQPYAESSTSSMTESGSDDGINDVNGTMTTSSQGDEDDEVASTTEGSAICPTQPSFSEVGKRFISMGQALSLSKQPRCVSLDSISHL